MTPLTLLIALTATACSETDPLPGDHRTSRQVTHQSSPLTVGSSYVSEAAVAGAFTLFAGGSTAPLVVGSDEHPGVAHAADNLRHDLGAVSGMEPELQAALPSAGTAIVIGTLGHSAIIDGLVSAGKLDAADLQGRWEKFVTTVVDSPAPGLDQALVVAGSDKRGTIYGVYDLAERIGVSPWGDFANVPVQQHSQMYVLPGRHTLGEPAVKYRGFFINDEAPALSDWYQATYNDNSNRFKSEFYVRVFDLLLRMKANFLWPAMWGKSFNADDVDNPRLADEYGIVMGTSHHEPMTRSQQEWTDLNAGAWDYTANKSTLQTFWRGGIERMGERETLVTVGMRGDGDVSLDGATRSLMEQIVQDQRAIIQDVTGKEPSTVPQVWALYKEVQTFYDQGMQTPEDVTLLMSDDNWGNIRRLPNADTAARSGGFGVYYHYDYVGGPRSYKWLNTNSVPRIWEQLRLAHQNGANQLWIVNVGDIKPMEYPISFFMDYAWNPDGFKPADLYRYPKKWAAAQFGAEHAEAIGRILSGYTKFNSRRKPELLEAATYSLGAFHEWESVVDDFNALVTEAESINDALDTRYKDAFYQLVLFPVAASANLNEMYYAQAKNQLFAQQKRASTNQWGTKVGQLFANDGALTSAYHSVANGQWNHMMKQTHISYTTWDQPATDTVPATQQYQATGAASLGIAPEGTTTVWPGGSGAATLPELIAYYPSETRFIELFNKGTGSFDFTVTSDAAYVTTTPASGTVTDESRVQLSVDWSQVPAGKTQVQLTVAGGGASIDVVLPLHKPDAPTVEEAMGFVESNGYVSIDPAAFSKNVKTDQAALEVIPDLGRTGNAVSATPANAASVAQPGGDSPHLEYPVHLFTSGQIKVRTYLSPTLPVHSKNLRYALSFDDAAPQILDMHTGLPADFTENTTLWQQWVKDNVITQSSNHTIASAGAHTLKLWLVDPGVVVQKLVVETGNVPTSYLGPPTAAPLGYTVPDPAPPEPSATLPPVATDAPSSDSSTSPPDPSTATSSVGSVVPSPSGSATPAGSVSAPAPSGSSPNASSSASTPLASSSPSGAGSQGPDPVPTSTVAAATSGGCACRVAENKSPSGTLGMLWGLPAAALLRRRWRARLCRTSSARG